MSQYIIGIRMALSLLLKLQVLYCMLGIGYNVVSYAQVTTGGRPLSSTSPAVGIGVMSVYGLCLLSGYSGHIKIYRLLMVLALIVFGYGGIIKHFLIMAHQPNAYSSITAWLAAIAINLFGFGLDLMAAAGRFEKGVTAST